MKWLCDTNRHLICIPYSIENLHIMAEQLGIGKHWYHGGKHPHYDIPKRRLNEIMNQCEIVSSKDIMRVINGQLGH